MRAVTFDVSVPRYLLARSLGRFTESVLVGALSGIRLGRSELRPLPGPRWARLRILKGGICGTDLSTVTFAASPALEPFGSFPAVLGHEILATVLEVGSEVRRVVPGQRVAVDPMISCEVRGWTSPDWCSSCCVGRHCTCENGGEEGPLQMEGEPMARGLTIGYHRSLPGGWAEEMLAHDVQLFPVLDELDDSTAALIEPMAIGVHAALGSPPRAGEPTLVIGSGPIALGTVWALRALAFDGDLIAQTRRPHEARLAERLGATSVVSPGEPARDALIETGARAYMPIVGPEVYAGGGFPLVFDCVGSRESLSQALAFSAPRGRIVLLGCAARMRGLDLSFLWSRELEVKGYVGYGRERFRNEERHTFEVTQELLAETGAPVRDLVTHVFPLGQYRDALSTALNRQRSGAVKVLLDPTLP